MLHRKIHFGLVSVLVITLLSACLPIAQAEITPTTDPQSVRTAAAATAYVRLTEWAGQAPLETPTPPSPTPDLVQTAAFETVIAGQTLVAQATPTLGATATLAPQSGGEDRAGFVLDVTIPDGTDFKPGEKFTKTWRLMNTGTSTWSKEYALGFASGEKMGGPDKVNLTTDVAPGKIVDVSVELTAPQALQRYRGYWKMMNARGEFFNDAFYVEIDVVDPGAPPAPTATPGGPTPTTPPSGATLSNVTMSVDTASFSGACPHTFTFTANFTLSAPATVSYKLEAGTSQPGFTFNLPVPVSGQFGAGVQTLVFTLQLTDSVTAWARLRITAPEDITSNEASFSLACQK